MTEEEIRALQEAAEESAKQIADLTAERDSLKEENEQLRSDAQKTAAELADTKKLNFTLARQIDRKPAASVEEILGEMLKKGR